MMVWETDRKSGTVREPASLPDYLDLKERSRTFEELAGFSAGAATLTGIPGDPARLPAIASTSEFLPLLGIAPVLGRTFTAEQVRDFFTRVTPEFEHILTLYYPQERPQ